MALSTKRPAILLTSVALGWMLPACCGNVLDDLGSRRSSRSSRAADPSDEVLKPLAKAMGGHMSARM